MRVDTPRSNIGYYVVGVRLTTQKCPGDEVSHKPHRHSIHAKCNYGFSQTNTRVSTDGCNYTNPRCKVNEIEFISHPNDTQEDGFYSLSYFRIISLLFKSAIWALAVAVLPTIPEDLLKLIWVKHWQEQAACTIQRAVREQLARHWGRWVRPGGYDSGERSRGAVLRVGIVSRYKTGLRLETYR